MKRPYGSGQIYEKWGAYYGRWRTPDGQRVNRRLGVKRTRGGSDGLTRAQAEQAMRRLQAEEAARRPIEPIVEIVTVDQAAERLRERITIEGARLSYRQTASRCTAWHVSPAIGRRKVASVTTRDVERLASAMLAKGASAKTVRNVMTFLHSVFALAEAGPPAGVSARIRCVSDESLKHDLRFHIGDAFPSTSPVARWLTACCMAANDPVYLNQQIFPRLQGDGPAFEDLYLGRLVASHLYEAARFLIQAERRYGADVQPFLDRLPASARSDFEAVKAIGPGGQDSIAEPLERLRNHFFHYAELIPKRRSTSS